MTVFERTRGPFTISTDPRRIDVDAVHSYLSRSYWAENIPRAIVERSIAGSLCFALLDEARQIGLARVITDRLPSTLRDQLDAADADRRTSDVYLQGLWGCLIASWKTDRKDTTTRMLKELGEFVILDSCDIASGASADCNANGFPDSCDLSNGTSLDPNGNGIPEECESSITSYCSPAAPNSVSRCWTVRRAEV